MFASVTWSYFPAVFFCLVCLSVCLCVCLSVSTHGIETFNYNHNQMKDRSSSSLKETGGRTDQPSFESDGVNVELFDDVQLVVHVLQQTQHL